MAVTISVEPTDIDNESPWTVTSDKDDATAKTITVFADYTGTVAGTVKVTTSVAHTYLTNDVVVITGTTNYNGTYDLTKIDADEFYITVAWVANDATGTVTLTNPNFRIKAELIISTVTVAVKWQPAGTLSWDFKNILWALITSDVIDFDSLNIQTPNSNSYETYTIKFTEYWENTSNALVTGANKTSDTKYIYEVDCTTFADYNLSADDEEFLTERPITNKIKIGDNLVTGWTNHTGDNGYDTFETSGRNITSAIDSSAANYGYCQSNALGALKKGDIIEFYCNFTKNTGTFPEVSIWKSTFFALRSNIGTLEEGLNYKKLTVTADILTGAVITIISAKANEVDFEMSQVYVSKGYNELDYLGFISEETDLSISCKQYNAAGTLIDVIALDEVTISGERGVCPISALLFAQTTSQVEKITLSLRKYDGADLITNGNFTNWTDDDPDDWDLSLVEPDYGEVTEVAGACKIIATPHSMGIQQDDIGIIENDLYKITLDCDAINGDEFVIIPGGGALAVYTTGSKVFLKPGGSTDSFRIYGISTNVTDFTIDDVTMITGEDMSKDITFVRDSVCWENPIRIEWLNKFGAFDAYTFLDDYNEIRTGKRSTYKDTSDVEQILDIENYQTIETFSNYETKTNLDWIKTILDSKKVYWIVDNERIEVMVIGLSQVKKKKERVKLALSFRKLV